MKKKVIFIVHSLSYGGVQASLLQALKLIDLEENDITLFVMDNKTELLDSIDKNINILINTSEKKYILFFLDFVFSVLLHLKSIAGLYKATNDFQKRKRNYMISFRCWYAYKKYFNKHITYDIAIAYIQDMMAEFTGRYINADKKYVFFHDSEDSRHYINDKAFVAFDKIIGVNDNVSENLKKWYPHFSNKVITIGNFVDAERVRCLAEEKIDDISRAKYIFCSCGRFSEVKGFDLAVLSAVKLKEKGIDFHWYFVGDGPEREKIVSLVNKHNLKNNITITGMKDNPYPYMKMCDVYVQPSRAESFGLTIIEAKILLKPVVSTMTVGGKSLINNGETGVLAGFSAEEISDEIVKLINNNRLMSFISDNLREIDYLKAKERYKKEWDKLLRAKT